MKLSSGDAQRALGRSLSLSVPLRLHLPKMGTITISPPSQTCGEDKMS